MFFRTVMSLLLLFSKMLEQRLSVMRELDQTEYNELPSDSQILMKSHLRHWFYNMQHSKKKIKMLKPSN